MKRILYSLMILFLPLSVVGQPKPYEANWESLARHDQAPDWFQDAKFGIYFHWGPYSVPAFGNEHYPRTMYGHPSGKKPRRNKNRTYNPGVGFQTFREHEFHKAKFGRPADFEYHDLIPLFRAERFDAQSWADLFFLAGARFAGPVAEHHDGYAMWDSELTPWNAADSGPHRDLVGEMAKAIRQRGLKFITTFHHARMGRAPAGSSAKEQRKWYYFGRQKYYERSDPGHQDSPKLQKLYGTLPWQEFLTLWNKKLAEVIDLYHPDLIWFDSWLDRIPQTNRQAFAAQYLNSARRQNQEVLITYKQDDLPSELGLPDFEKGRLDEIAESAWLTDDTISAGPWTTTGSWSYTEDLDIKSSAKLIHTLIDIVSKNGCLLLNVSPTASGIIPREQRESLLGMGKWLRANSEAIYGTRPFLIYGEGPKRMISSGHFVQMKQDYNYENIRYTTKGNTLYAIQMGWPGSNSKLLLKSLSREQRGNLEIKSVSVVDSPEEIDWELTPAGLQIYAPLKPSNKIALCYKIETNGKFPLAE